jgi:hypothetical protein
MKHGKLKAPDIFALLCLCRQMRVAVHSLSLIDPILDILIHNFAMKKADLNISTGKKSVGFLLGE